MVLAKPGEPIPRIRTRAIAAMETRHRERRLEELGLLVIAVSQEEVEKGAGIRKQRELSLCQK